MKRQLQNVKRDLQKQHKQHAKRSTKVTYTIWKGSWEKDILKCKKSTKMTYTTRRETCRRGTQSEKRPSKETYEMWPKDTYKSDLYKVKRDHQKRLTKCDKKTPTKVTYAICKETCTGTFNTLQRSASHFHTQQHTSSHCVTLQNAATQCSTLQHTAAQCVAPTQYEKRPAQVRSPHCNARHSSAALPIQLMICNRKVGCSGWDVERDIWLSVYN